MHLLPILAVLFAHASASAPIGMPSAPGPNASTVQRARHAGTIVSIVVMGVVALVGILIFAQVEEALPDLDSGHPLEETTDAILEGFGSALEFVPIVMLVMLASVVILVVGRMRA